MFKIIPNGMPNGWSLLEGLDVEFGWADIKDIKVLVPKWNEQVWY